MQNAYKYEDEYNSIPYIVKSDKRVKRKNRKEFKDTCRIVALVWLLCLAFIAPIMMPGMLGKAYGVLMMGSMVLQVLGW